MVHEVYGFWLGGMVLTRHYTIKTAILGARQERLSELGGHITARQTRLSAGKHVVTRQHTINAIMTVAADHETARQHTGHENYKP